MPTDDLRQELTCSICLSIFTDPIYLKCGHNFCHSCIGSVLDAQDKSADYFCPDCRAKYPERPTLEKNRKLANIVKYFLSTILGKDEVKNFCTYCEFHFPAAKMCLQCGTFFCAKHLRNHNNLVDHVLIEPQSSMENVTCSAHKKVLNYFCVDHNVCVCVSCFAFGEHRGHQIEEITVASEKKEENLRRIMDKLSFERVATEKNSLKLKEHVQQVQVEADVLGKRITGQFEDLKRELEILETQVMSEISRQTNQISEKFFGVVHLLEARKAELTQNISQIQDMVKRKDVFSILQAQELHKDHMSDGNPYTERDKVVLAMGDLNIGLIYETLHKGMAEIVTKVKTCIFGRRVLPIIMDVNTAHSKMEISKDLKTISDSDVNHGRPELPSRFTIYNQVLSTNSFKLGQHYWEVETSIQGIWDIGVAYSSIERDGKCSGIGDNNRSWCLRRYTTKYMAAHNSKAQSLLFEQCSQLIGIYLNYDAGHLTFYELCDPDRYLFRRLYTFTVNFQEPLHAAFYVDDGAWIKVLL